MANVLFLPNAGMLPWLFQFPGEPAELLVERIQGGEWIFGAEMRQSILRHFVIEGNLVLRARNHGGVVVVSPETPLRPRPLAIKVILTDQQYQVLQLMAQGLSAGQIGKAMGFKKRWAFERIAEIKLRTGSATREEAVRKLREEEDREREAGSPGSPRC